MKIVIVETQVPQQPIQLKANSKYTERFATVVLTSLETTTLVDSVSKMYTKAMEEDILSPHMNSWMTMWQSNIEIEGDDSIRATVTTGLYYLYSSVRSDWIFGIADGGIVSDQHVTFRAETHIFPVLLYLHPTLAKSILQYRFNRLDTASYHAKENHFEGYMFPRESGFTGREVGAKITSPMDVHVSGEVVLAVQKYVQVSSDIDFMLNYGFSVVSNVARFLNSRANLRLDTHFYHYEKVIGPDPSHFNINDDAYTNAVSSIVLHTAHRFVDQYAHCYAHYRYLATLWKDLADNIHMPYIADDSRHDSYIGYLGDHIRYPSLTSVHYPLRFMRRSKLLNTHIYENITPKKKFFK